MLAQGQITLPDKEVEQKLTEVTNIVSLGFKMPPNMAISLIKILVDLLVLVLPIEKDFLLQKSLDLFNKVITQSDTTVFDNKVVQEASL